MCAMVIGLVAGTLFGAVFLRAAIALYNKMAGGASSSKRVPEPAVGSAMKIMFAILFFQMLIGFLIGDALGDGIAAVKVGEKKVDVVTLLISLSVSTYIMSMVLSVLLPTTFRRAFLVTLCYWLVGIIVAGVLAAIAFAVYGLSLLR